jgi:hypothetical protein
MKNKIISILLAIITVCTSVAIVYFAAVYNPLKPEEFDSLLGFSCYAVYAVMILAFICLVGFALWSIIANFKDSKATLVGVGVLVAVLLIGYLISAPTNSAVEQRFAVGTGLSKVIGGGIVATYIFMFGAILAAVWATLSSRFK